MTDVELCSPTYSPLKFSHQLYQPYLFLLIWILSTYSISCFTKITCITHNNNEPSVSPVHLVTGVVEDCVVLSPQHTAPVSPNDCLIRLYSHQSMLSLQSDGKHLHTLITSNTSH